MLSEIYPGGSPKTGSNYWNQIQEIGMISVSRRILKRFHEFLEQVLILQTQNLLIAFSLAEWLQKQYIQ